jgi:hypothetical protein
MPETAHAYAQNLSGKVYRDELAISPGALAQAKTPEVFISTSSHKSTNNGSKLSITFYSGYSWFTMPLTPNA